MTLSRKILKRVNSPSKSPKLTNSSLRRRTLLKRLSSNNVQFGTSSKANLKVVVRVRPENQREIDNNARSVVDIVDENMLIFDPKHEEDSFFFQGAKQKYRDLNKRHHKEQKFIFERVFNPLSTNNEIFETTTKDIVDTLLSGYNCSVFAYGATGSGKTYTMIGTEKTPGISFLTVMELYKKIGELKDEKQCEIGVSYLEVYNEMVRDLLAPGKPLNLHETGQHVQVTGLSLHKPKDADELLQILREGNRNRSQHPTDANAESSRSHAVFQVFLRQQNRCSDIKAGVSIAKLSMIDLAGSERGAATGFKGARFREGANINKSLLALGNCINALADGKGHIPYRDSKLTRLLKDSIGGNCRSVMIATITKYSLSFEDTYNTLRYANRAKTIKTTLKKNIMNVDQHVHQYLKVVEGLKEEISGLKEKLKEYEERESEGSYCVPHREIPDDERKVYEETVQALKKRLEETETVKEKKDLVEEEFLSKLMDLNLEFRGRQREILQLESVEKELVKKIYVQKLHVVRMNIFAFASVKLDKGISKSKRSILAHEKHLDHILKKKSELQGRTTSIRESIASHCRDYRNVLANNEVDSTPEIIILKLKENDLEQSVRDSYQINEHLKTVVKNLIGEQAKNEKLIALLLVAMKHFYLKLKSLNECDGGTNEFLENIYAMLDESRIEWADLKNTDESFGEQIVSEHVQLVQTIDANELIKFPQTQSIDISPVLWDASKTYKRSNLKKSSRNMNLLSQSSLAETRDICTPISSKTFALNMTSVAKDEFSMENSIGETLTLEKCFESPSNINTTFSPNSKNNPSQVDSCTPPSPDLKVISPNYPVNIQLPYSISEDSSNILPVIEETSNSNNLNTTITLSNSPPKLELDDGDHNAAPEILITRCNETLSLDPDLALSNERASLITSNTDSSKLTSSRENLVSNGELTAKEVEKFDTNIQNSTFSFNSTFCDTSTAHTKVESPLKSMNSTLEIVGANDTFSILPEESSSEIVASYPAKVLQDLSSSTVKNKDNIQTKMGFRKLGSGLTPSKYSSSRLLPSAPKSLNKGLKKKSSSVSSLLHNTGGRFNSLYSGNQGKDNLKKSISGIMRQRVCSTIKNQENAPPPRTTVAFGSSFSKSPKTSSKKMLSFNPPYPPEK